MTVSDEVDRDDAVNTVRQRPQTLAVIEAELLEALQLSEPFE